MEFDVTVEKQVEVVTTEKKVTVEKKTTDFEFE